MQAEHDTDVRMHPHKQIELALTVLGQNQGMVQFADAKANGLVLVNSIFLAVLVPGLATPGASPGPLAAVFFGVCALAMMASLLVIVSRKPRDGESRSRSLVYYKDVACFRRGASYAEAFQRADPVEVLGSVLDSVHDVARIAQVKFRWYRAAELLTLCAAVLWVMALVGRAV